MDTYQLIQSVLVGGVATTLATQFLKSPLVSFIPAEKYPQLTAIAVSLVAAAFAVYQAGFNPTQVTDWVQWAAVGAGTLLIASTTYTQLIEKDE